MSAVADGIPTLSGYLRIIRRYWWLPVIGVVLGAALGALSTTGADSSFQANAQVLVQTSLIDGEPMEAASQARIVESLALLTESRSIEQRVSAQLASTAIPPVSVIAVSGANVLELAVRGENAETTVELVNAYAAALAESAHAAVGATAVVITEAVGTTETGPGLSRTAALFAFVGLVLGVGTALALQLRAQRFD